MPGPSSAEPKKSEVTRERILDAAAETFAEQGYHGASMDAIVERSRTSKGAIYFHFPSKESIFSALVERLGGALESSAKKAIARERGATARVDAALQTFFQTISRYHGLARVILIGGVGLGPSLDKRLLALHDRFAGFIKSYLDDAVSDGSIPPIDTEMAAYVWLGAINEVVVRWLHTGQPHRLEDALPELRAFLLRSVGVAPRTQTGPAAKAAGRARAAAEAVWLKRAADLLASGRRKAERRGRPIIVSFSQPLDGTPDALGLYASARRVGVSRALWLRPREGAWLVGAGRAGDIRPDVSGEPLAQAAARLRDMVRDALVDGDPGPVFMGGFSFDARTTRDSMWNAFPAGLLVLPRWTVVSRNGAAHVTVNAVVDGGSDVSALLDALDGESHWLREPMAERENPVAAPEPDADAAQRWRRAVSQALDAIQGHKIAKVTLARSVAVRADAPLQSEPLLRRLAAQYTECRVFAFEWEGACFLGATPEDLISLSADGVAATCLAGSTRRGGSPEEDAALADRLLRSDKERWEHDVVVKYVAERLTPRCAELRWNDPPRVMTLRNLHHLATTFTGKPKEGLSVLDLAAALHPTPATGGVPLDAALAAIRALEGMDRGWYAGPVGWVDARGNGELGVAIRSALLRGNEARLYAGAGIVEGSDPDSEFRETAMKFRPLLSALGVE